MRQAGSRDVLSAVIAGNREVRELREQITQLQQQIFNLSETLEKICTELQDIVDRG